MIAFLWMVLQTGLLLMGCFFVWAMALGLFLSIPKSIRAYRAKRQGASAALQRALAGYAHTAWSGWMEYLFRLSVAHADGTVTIPADKVARWRRQMNTPYSALSVTEQASDLIEATTILSIVERQRG